MDSTTVVLSVLVLKFFTVNSCVAVYCKISLKLYGNVLYSIPDNLKLIFVKRLIVVCVWDCDAVEEDCLDLIVINTV